MPVRIGRYKNGGPVVLSSTTFTRVDIQDGIEWVYLGADGPWLFTWDGGLDEGSSLPSGYVNLYRVGQDVSHPVPVARDKSVRLLVIAESGTPSIYGFGVGDFLEHKPDPCR